MSNELVVVIDTSVSLKYKVRH